MLARRRCQESIIAFSRIIFIFYACAVSLDIGRGICILVASRRIYNEQLGSGIIWCVSFEWANSARFRETRVRMPRAWYAARIFASDDLPQFHDAPADSFDAGFYVAAFLLGVSCLQIKTMPISTKHHHVLRRDRYGAIACEVRSSILFARSRKTCSFACISPHIGIDQLLSASTWWLPGTPMLIEWPLWRDQYSPRRR